MDSVCTCDRCQGIEWMIEEELKMQEAMDFDIDVDLDADFNYPEPELDPTSDLPKTRAAISEIAAKLDPTPDLPMPQTRGAIRRIVAKLELRKKPAVSVGL